MTEHDISTAADEPGAETAHTQERHTSWAELFFDLVVVAAIGTFGHVLHHPTWTGLALFAVGFGALWTCWTSYMLYGNAAGDTARSRCCCVGCSRWRRWPPRCRA